MHAVSAVFFDFSAIERTTTHLCSIFFCRSMRMKSHDAFVRMPLTLAEPAFIWELRQGVAIRSLHRISFLSRLNSIIEEALDRTIDGKNVKPSVTPPCI